MNTMAQITAITRFNLTERQAECFRTVERLIAAGQSPTSREIAKAMGISSPGRVHVLLVALQERGWITFIPKKQRSITIVPGFPAADALTLPADIEERLRTHCAATGENPSDVLADAVTLFFDDAEGSVAA
jgi:SOS-response transcriptional repressor LexA